MMMGESRGGKAGQPQPQGREGYRSTAAAALTLVPPLPFPLLVGVAPGHEHQGG